MLFIPVDFRHRPEKIVKSHDSLIELVLVTYRAYRSTRKGKKKKKKRIKKIKSYAVETNVRSYINVPDHIPDQNRYEIDEFRVESSTGWTRVMQY